MAVNDAAGVANEVAQWVTFGGATGRWVDRGGARVLET